jgi:hypothetical protein
VIARASVPQEQHRDIGVGGYKLQTPCRHHRYLASVRHHGRGRPIADGIFDDRQQRRFIARLRVNYICRAKPSLFEARRI